MRPDTARRYEAGPGARGEAAVHARDAVVAGAEVAAGRLQENQRRDPGRGRRVGADALLKPMVFGRDEDIEIVRRVDRGPVWIAAARLNRRLHEGWPGHVFDDEPPGLVVRPARGQPA